LCFGVHHERRADFYALISAMPGRLLHKHAEACEVTMQHRSHRAVNPPSVSADIARP
jgi:hypothetical protein